MTTYSTRFWPAGNQVRLRVIATDGINTTTATTDPFVIPDHAPEVAIASVVEGGGFTGLA